MLCTQRPPWISDPDISDNSPVFPSILIINSLCVPPASPGGEGGVGVNILVDARHSSILYLYRILFACAHAGGDLPVAELAA
jgi:hypothetical protein